MAATCMGVQPPTLTHWPHWAEGGCKAKRLCAADCHTSKRLCTRRSPADGGEDVESTFQHLTPSDVRLTRDALLRTKVAHFGCNLDGCTRSVELTVIPTSPQLVCWPISAGRVRAGSK
jgi:hypothetical protein